jgi:hypothetical protein
MLHSLKSLRDISSPKSLRKFFSLDILEISFLVDLMRDPLNGGLASKSYIMRDFHGGGGHGEV